MFNITIINMKSIFKYLLVLIIIFVIYLGNKYFFSKKINLSTNFNMSKYSNKIINISLPEIEYFSKIKNEQAIDDDEEVINLNRNNIGEYILNSELSLFQGKILKIAKKQNEQNTDNEIVNQENTIEFAKTEGETEIATQNPISESYNQEYQSVKIRNETNFDLTDDILNPDNLNINNSNIILFHTHTCESYTSSEKYQYIPTGNYRTTDLNFTVSRVGDCLTEYLSAYGFNILHDKTYHDYPAYTGSYTRSLSTVQNLLTQMNSDIIIDLHRDAIGSNSNYDPTVKIGDDYASQIMFVIGTNGGGLYHPGWNSNLKFAVKIQKKANELYPGLFKPIILRNSRYNQQLGKAACIIEVGATGNTLEQCLTSMKYLSEVMNQTLK